MFPSKKNGFKLNPYICALLPLTMHGIANALPTLDGVPVGVSVSQGSGYVLVDQSAQNVLINWSDFSTATGEIVQFTQPNTSSIAVNRVTGQEASVLNGALYANGRVFLINPNGVLFNENSSVNVGGLLATTFDISQVDFNAGRFVFSDSGAGQGDYAGVVRNQGSIVVGVDGRIAIGNETSGPPLTDGGSLTGGDFAPADVDATTPGIAVLAGRTVDNQTVENQASINAYGGQILLASGSALSVSFDNGLISYEVTPKTIEAANDLAAISNSGVLSASGGSITLMARASNTTPGVGILNSGAIRANGISLDGDGGIYLTATGGSADAGGVSSAGTILVQGADVTLNDALIRGSSQVRIVAASGDVTGGPGSQVSGSAVGILASGNVALDGSYQSFINAEVLAAPDLEGALDPGSISIQGAAVALDGATVDAATQFRVAATAGDITSSASTNVSGDSLDVQASGNVQLTGSFLAGTFIRSPNILVAPSKEATIDPNGISIQGASVDLDDVQIIAAGPVRIAATAGDVNALSFGNEVSGSALDIRATGSVKLGGYYRTGAPLPPPEIFEVSNTDGALALGTIFVQGADVVLDGVSIDAENQVGILATAGDIVGLPSDGEVFNDVYGSALDIRAAGSIKLSGSYLAGFDPSASVAFVDEASETGDLYIQGSEVIFNGASVTGSGEVRIIAESGNVSDLQVGGTQITGNALGIQAAGSILLGNSMLTVGGGQTSIGGDPTIGNVLGVIERLQALYPPSAEESASITARADGFESLDTSGNPPTPVSPPIFVPNHTLPNASFVSGEGGVIQIGSLQMSGDYLFLQSNNPSLPTQFNPTSSLFIQFVPAGLGGSVSFEQNPGLAANLNLSPSFFSDITNYNATLVFGSISNPGNVFVGQQGPVANDTSGFNYVLAAGAGGLIFNPERLFTPGEVVVLGLVASGGPRPPIDPPPGPDVLFPSPLPPGQTAEFIAARSEPVTRSASDLTFDVAAALDSSIQYNSAAGPILACQ